jgi:hypothetical protein
MLELEPLIRLEQVLEEVHSVVGDREGFWINLGKRDGISY